MHIEWVHIEGFRRFSTLDLELRPGHNILVGDNATGKSTVLEALSLVLTGKHEGRLVLYALDPYFFNSAIVAAFFRARQRGEHASPPRIVIEAYLSGDDPDNTLPMMQGTHNSRGENRPGLSLTIDVAHEHGAALAAYASDPGHPPILPMEYYRPAWRSFKGDGVTTRSLPLHAARIDTSAQPGTRYTTKYVSGLVEDILTDDQQRALAMAYRQMHYDFMAQPGVTEINESLAAQTPAISDKTLTVQMDVSANAGWGSAVTPHLDDLPFACAGRGEQSQVLMRMAIVGAAAARILLIEEPENHLSHAGLNKLLDRIKVHCTDRQALVSTHSTFVLNKLGLHNLILLAKAGTAATLTALEEGTREYFMKLPGYNTLRLVLAERSLLVEGPSDELIVQKAYQMKMGRLPLEDGVDVITVGSLAFRRFLAVAAPLQLTVGVVIDNDGDIASLEKRYAEYLSEQKPTIRVHYDPDESCPTLEPQLLKANGLETLNAILGTSYSDEAAMLEYMRKNKTDCALKFFNTTHSWNIPEYIERAIE